MAKFKIGDKVEILTEPKKGKKGKIESSAPEPMGGEIYHVRLDDGFLQDVAERNLAIANAAVRSRNAAPKPGDKVFWRNGPFKFEGVFVKELPNGCSRDKADGREIVVCGKVYLEGQNPSYTNTPFGRVFNSAPCRSTNPVVNAALNAMAANGCAARARNAAGGWQGKCKMKSTNPVVNAALAAKNDANGDRAEFIREIGRLENALRGPLAEIEDLEQQAYIGAYGDFKKAAALGKSLNDAAGKLWHAIQQAKRA